jgi:DNA-binding transcriptional MerR regulator
MRIGELAKSVDVNVETIRYYQRIGLLGLPEKPYGGTRFYSGQDLRGCLKSPIRQLKLVRVGKR